MRKNQDYMKYKEELLSFPEKIQERQDSCQYMFEVVSHRREIKFVLNGPMDENQDQQMEAVGRPRTVFSITIPNCKFPSYLNDTFLHFREESSVK